MAFEFKLTRRIEFAETDMAGIVHFSNFFRMMEAAEHAFIRSLGFSIHSRFGEDTVGWPRVSATCDYVRPLRFEEEVEIHLLVAELRPRSVRYEFVFRKPAEGLEVARGSVVAVCVRLDPHSGKLEPIAIPEPLRAKISVAPPELLMPKFSSLPRPLNP